MPSISQAADDLIIASEVSSKAYYDKVLRRPEWPGGRSGVTVGIGYDLGYASAQKIRADWAARLPNDMLSAMLICSGISGSAAQALLPQVRNRIDVPWDKAVEVYEDVDIPEWTDRVCRIIPGAEELPPDCLGALVSLAYNRGAGGFTAQGDRYREMRAIRSHIIALELGAVPAEFRSMTRLWPDMKGLRIRRDQEAKLWERGLQNVNVKPLPKPDVPRTPSVNPTPLEPPKRPGTPEAGGTAGSIVVAGGASKAAHDAGYGWQAIGTIVAIGVIAAIIVTVIIRHRRSQPTLANAKD